MRRNKKESQAEVKKKVDAQRKEFEDEAQLESKAQEKEIKDKIKGSQAGVKE